MIDTKEEVLLSLTQAAAAVPPVDGKRPHVSSIWRWMNVGIRGVHLEHVRVGRRVCTSRDALERFMHALAEAPAPEARPQPRKARARTEKQRAHDVAKAKEGLAKHGTANPTNPPAARHCAQSTITPGCTLASTSFPRNTIMYKTLREIMAAKFRKGCLGHDTVTGFDFKKDPPLTRARAIRAKCLECQAGQQAEVARCQTTDCTLWPYRSGRKQSASNPQE